MSKMYPIARPGIAGLALVAGLLAAALLSGLPGERPDLGPIASYIVQDESLAEVRSQGLNGSGVAIAFIDTGIESEDGISPTKTRNVAYYSALKGKVTDSVSDSMLWADALAEPVAINVGVPQE